MTISKRIRSQLFTSSSPAAPSTASASSTAEVTTTTTATDAIAETTLIRLPLHRPVPGARKRRSRAKKCQLPQRGLGWSDDEHERFLRGLENFPTGPWKAIATFVGTRTTRQVMTHAQKYRQKIARRQRGLQTQSTRKQASSGKSCGDDDNEAMDTPFTTTMAASIEPTQMDVKIEKVDLSTRYDGACGPTNSSLPTTSSPSSIDHAMGAFGFFSSTANVALDDQSASKLDERSRSYINACFLPVVGMTDDEFCVATDEELWMNQQFDECDDHMLLNLQDDPLALMFQDPSTFDTQHKKSAMLTMDVVYSAHSTWTRTHHSSMMEASTYVCQL